jgi:hypothetical protein
MGFFEKIKNIIAPPAKQGQPLWETKPDKIEREFGFFKDSFRIGILAFCSTQTDHDEIHKYKKELDILGYETEALFYVDAKELPRFVMLPHIKWADLDKQKKPISPRPDRFMKKKFDLLLNIYFEESSVLQHISSQSMAKCRVGAYRPHLISANDVFVYTEEENNITKLIAQINLILQKQAHERKIY